MSLIVKICGMTSVADAQAAIQSGADAVGFVFCESSPRRVSVTEAAAIAHELPPSVVKVGVFVDAPEELVFQAMRDCGLNLLQFHGNEKPEYCRQFGLMSMKAFRVRDADSLKALPEFQTDAWLLDAYAPGKPGGTGEKFNWELAVQAQKLGGRYFLRAD